MKKITRIIEGRSITLRGGCWYQASIPRLYPLRWKWALSVEIHRMVRMKGRLWHAQKMSEPAAWTVHNLTLVGTADFLSAFNTNRVLSGRRWPTR